MLDDPGTMCTAAVIALGNINSQTATAVDQIDEIHTFKAPNRTATSARQEQMADDCCGRVFVKKRNGF